MANLTAVFDLVDNMSAKMDAIASSGESAVANWERMGEAADSALSSGSSAASGVASAVTSYGSAAESAAGSTDYWTSAVGNFDKGLLEATMSVEELVEAGYKTSEALEEQQSVMEMAQMATEDLSNALKESTYVHDECAEAMEKAAQTAEELAESDKVSEEAKEALREATEAAADAMNELEAAESQAAAAQENYNAVMESGNATIREIEEAALSAAEAADQLAAANDRVTSATEELSKASEDAANGLEDTENSGVGAIENIASALAAAGITATLEKITSAVYDMADAFSESEKIIVNATGATGESLDGLSESMLDAYTMNEDSLEDTAAAVGEINTRMGLTGDELTDVTAKYMDFADATGGNAATSVKNVTQLMSQWNVPASEMSTTLDKLTYAGQASGISVDSLSQQLISNKSILDEFGFSLDEATAMFMKFELTGTQTTSVMTGLRTALSSGAITSVEELYNTFEQLQSGEMSATDASEIFGSKAGPAIANAAKSGVFELDEMVAALQNSEGLLETTAEAGESLSEKWQRAGNNISAAFTSVLEPAISETSSGLVEMVNGFGDFLNEHPTVVKAITVIGVGLGTAAAALAAVSAAAGVYTAATTIATAVTTAFGEAVSAAILPVTAIVAGIAALATAVYFIADAYSDAGDETQNMSAATEKQYYELKELEAEYDNVCETYGETSYQAQEMAAEVDAATAAFEESRMTVDEFNEAMEELHETAEEARTGLEEMQGSISDIDTEAAGAMSLTDRLRELATATDISGAAQAEMGGIIDILNGKFENLGLTYDDVINDTDNVIKAIENVINADAKEQKQQLALDEWSKQTENLAAAKEKVALAQEEVNAQAEKSNSIEAEYQEAYSRFANGEEVNNLTQLADAYVKAQNELDDYNGTLEQAEQDQADVEAAVEAAKEAYLEATGCSIELADATDDMNTAASDMALTITSLQESYTEVYNSALESFQGQFSLWDEAKASTEISVSSMNKSLDSQITYWENYSSNLDNLSSRNIEGLDAMVASINDGSEEAAGALASMAGASNEQLEAMVEKYNAVSEAQESAANSTADMSTGFTDKMAEYGASIDEMVQKMDQSEAATTAGTNTMAAYAAALTSGEETGSVAETVKAAFEGAIAEQEITATATVDVDTTAIDNVTLDPLEADATYNLDSTEPDEYEPEDKDAEAIYDYDDSKIRIWEPMDKYGTVYYTAETKTAGHAAGTLNAPEDVFIAGEEGPELIVGQKGSTVFPAEETQKIVKAVSGESGNGGATYIWGIVDALAELLDEKIGGAAAYGSGTTNSEENFIAGENGPELVVGKASSEVFSTGETDRLIDAVSPLFVPPSEGGSSDGSSSKTSGSGDKTVTLVIDGKGSIKVDGGGIDDESMMRYLYAYIKPVLLDILKQEIYEEGDGSYNY